MNATEKKIEICLGMVTKHCGKRRKCWFPAFSPFPTMFSEGVFLGIVESWDCVVNSFRPKKKYSRLRSTDRPDLRSTDRPHFFPATLRFLLCSQKKNPTADLRSEFWYRSVPGFSPGSAANIKQMSPEIFIDNRPISSVGRA